MQKIIMTYTFGDGMTYSTDKVFPIQAESVEAALCAFEDAYNKAKAVNGMFEFAGDVFYPRDFEENDIYYAPDFVTLEEWFEDSFVVI